MSIDFYSESVTPEVPAKRNWLFPVILSILLGGAVLGLYLANRPPGLTQGVWVFDGDAMRVVLDFDSTGGLISGSIHEVRENRAEVQRGFAGTRKSRDEIELIWGVNNTLALEMDLREGKLQGRLLEADGSAHDMVFHRAREQAVPGLRAMETLPYRLRQPSAGSGWKLAEPAQVGIKPRYLEKTYRAISRGQAGLIHSQLVVRRGKLVSEEYFHGYSRDDLHEIQSATKSIVSLLIGIALDRGEIEDLDEPVLKYFPDYTEIVERRWEAVSLRHLLTMTAGLDWDRREVNQFHGAGPDLFKKVFARQIAHEPGARWLYNGAEVNLLAGVIHRATGLHADVFASRHLFEPMGIVDWDWDIGKAEGYPSLAGTLLLRPLDMAKIGQLVLDRGLWQGERIVSEAWIVESTAPTISTSRDVQRFGYLWWRLDAPLDAGRYPVTIASGWGSQFIHIVPAFDAVLVTTGGNQLNGKTFAIDQVLLRHLVPGIER